MQPMCHIICHRPICNKYISPSYCRAEMYDGRITYCPLVSHGEYTNGTVGQTDGRTDARPLHMRFSLDAASV